MNEGFTHKPFKTPEEEIAYLREQIASRERELLMRNGESDHADYETLAKKEIREYAEHAPSVVLDPKAQADAAEIAGLAEHLKTARHTVEEVLHIAEERGIRNVLSALERVKDTFVVDAAHDALVSFIRVGKKIADFREGAPLWNVLHMTLFTISLPEISRDDDKEQELSKIVSAMEQLYAGLGAISGGRTQLHFSVEIAVSDKSDDIVFYIAVPTQYIDLFEKQLLSLFPHAVVTEEKNDYNIFVEGGTSLVSVGELRKHPMYPLRTFDLFDHDPLRVLLNAFSKIERAGGGAAIQFLVRPRSGSYHREYEEILRRVGRGMSIHKALDLSTTFGTLKHFVIDEFLSQGPKEERVDPRDAVPQEVIELLKKKIAHPIHEVLIRVAVSAKEKSRAEDILHEIEASFHQFENTLGNSLSFPLLKGSVAAHELHQFSFREITQKYILPLSERELGTLIHIPRGSASLSPQFKQTQAVSAPAPANLPQEGTLLGRNLYRTLETKVFITKEDRLRHFYIIGQTGTGKTTLMKNMIMQDIRDGAGVCMIDPHGTDVYDVLASIPSEREKDLIYFDPSYLDRVMGLNMLEYDPRFPEQKTFVVNELFSIFQKLYGANPESMGPMFEQYFRNATMLVLEDPSSGSTLLDVSRVMADEEYRALKLSRARNPVVVQFWRDIATKAGGEASLENIVPYITSKFDVFTANDYMRPIIGQQHSSFNFREVMDEKKILLVNLAKGRLGEINANLIGMIIVGKILMAALSRADAPGKSFPHFYLHIDEFQNITTNSIAAILSEARKYKLGMTLAHQYIQQIDEKIRDAVFGNVGSMAVFRVGPEDAQYLENQFAPTFTKNDLLYIPNRHAYVRLLANGTPTKPFDIGTEKPPEPDTERAQRLITLSQQTHSRPRDEVEQDIIARYQ